MNNFALCGSKFLQKWWFSICFETRFNFLCRLCNNPPLSLCSCLALCTRPPCSSTTCCKASEQSHVLRRIKNALVGQVKRNRIYGWIEFRCLGRNVIQLAWLILSTWIVPFSCSSRMASERGSLHLLPWEAKLFKNLKWVQFVQDWGGNIRCNNPRILYHHSVFIVNLVEYFKHPHSHWFQNSNTLLPSQCHYQLLAIVSPYTPLECEWLYYVYTV